MIDFTNKCIVTENNVESEQLLKKAIAQVVSKIKSADRTNMLMFHWRYCCNS